MPARMNISDKDNPVTQLLKPLPQIFLALLILILVDLRTYETTKLGHFFSKQIVLKTTK